MNPLEAEDPAWIGSYRLLGRLGSGGMGEVFLGRSGDGRFAAIKAAHAQLAHDADFRRRFTREVDAARKVGARFTAAVIDADPGARRPWLATEYIPGVSVTDAVAADGPLPEAALRGLLAGVAEALDAIHGAGLVHRDLKPSNVLLADDGPRVIDFGIARSVEHSQITRTGQAPGTPGYMAPEQLRGGTVGPPTDVYALGATLVFAATGDGPFGHGDPLAMIYRTMEDEPQLDGLPESLRETVNRCLAKDPALRPELAELRAGFAVPDEVRERRWLPPAITTMVTRPVVPPEALTPGGGPLTGPGEGFGPAPMMQPPATPWYGTPGPTPAAVPPPSGGAGRGRLSRRAVLGLSAGIATVAVGGGGAFALWERDSEGGGDAKAKGNGDGESLETGTPAEEGQPERTGPASAKLPAITAGKKFGQRPTVAATSGAAPTDIVSRTLIKGTGKTVKAGDHLKCHYVLQFWDTGKILDASFKRDGPEVFQLGIGQVLRAWDATLVGKRAGSRVEFTVPPEMGYGREGSEATGVKGDDTLLCVVDIVEVIKVREE
ncbi:serine/threonine protein kinase [Streptomyces sp. AJS327]|uniref:protein kinase domain-containing protein n=1 Tax=Streptomyces sp. AJS327 TaxID=2545265 RepID=UPI0015DF0D1D|nr:protein kinase [Streptomyces sp. AJS327]MBA0052580.1 serine/threonine protein kinase [Streptomyces sp. AJS327]